MDEREDAQIINNKKKRLGKLFTCPVAHIFCKVEQTEAFCYFFEGSTNRPEMHNITKSMVKCSA